MANSFKFVNSTKIIPYAKGKYTVPFQSVFDSSVFFTYSDNSIVKNAQMNKNQTEVSFDIVTEGGTSTRTLTLTARTIPDYNVDAIFEQTGATQVVINPTQVEYIKYAEADGTEVTINSSGAITWPSSSTYHSLFLKFDEDYDGYMLFYQIQGIKSARVYVEDVGNSMFDSSSIEECMFVDGVTSLGSEVFLYCTNFTTVWLPQTFQVMDNRNFARTKLARINCYFQDAVDWGTDNFDGVGSTVEMYWLDNGTNLDQDWLTECEEGGATTVIAYRLDYPEEGNEYDSHLYYYSGIIEEMNYNPQYEVTRILSITSNLTIYQNATVIYLEKNICENISVTIPSNNEEYVRYKVYTNGEEIFDGKVLANGNTVTINLNSIIEKHITTDFEIPARNKAARYSNYGLFELDYSYNDFVTTNHLGGVIKVYNDWSYISGLKTSLTNQLEKNVCVYQPIIECFALHKGESGTTTITYERENGTTRQVTSQTFEQCSIIVHANANDTDNSYKVIGVIIRFTAGNNTIEHKYTIKRVNGDRVDAQMRMYARNKLSGFDSLSFNRASKETDNFTISTYTEDSSTSNSIITNQYQKDIAHIWNCQTNWISQTNSPLVQDLFASTQAYLQTIEHFTSVNYKNDIIPVNITNNKAEKKNFFSNNRKFNQYTIDLEQKEKNKFI